MKKLIFALILLQNTAFAREFKKQIADVPVINEGGSWVSQWTSVTLPEGLQSLQILVTGSPESFVQVTDLISPDGTGYVVSTYSKPPVLNSYSQPILNNVTCPERSEAVVQGIGSLIVPNNPALPPLKEGVWRLRSLTHYPPTVKTVTFNFVGKFPEEASKKRIDIHVVVSPDSYWTKTPGQVDRLLAEAKKVFKDEVGFDLNVVKVENLDARPKTPMVLPDDMTVIARSKNDLHVVNVYLMPTMQFQNKPINGLACLGGPQDLQIPHGCFVSMYAADTGAETIDLPNQAKILVHELGHYLGLFHTVDTGYYRIGTMHDSLSDTPEDGLGSNMMDPGIHNEAPHFSPMQKQMMLLSPILR